MTKREAFGKLVSALEDWQDFATSEPTEEDVPDPTDPGTPVHDAALLLESCGVRMPAAWSALCLYSRQHGNEPAHVQVVKALEAADTLLGWARGELTPLCGPAVEEPQGVVYQGHGVCECESPTRSIKLEGSQAAVLEALMKLGAATKRQLEDASDIGDAVGVLRTIRKKHPLLAAHIRMPGARGSGGYSTTIIDNRPLPQ